MSGPIPLQGWGDLDAFKAWADSQPQDRREPRVRAAQALRKWMDNVVVEMRVLVSMGFDTGVEAVTQSPEWAQHAMNEADLESIVDILMRAWVRGDEVRAHVEHRRSLPPP